MEPVVIEGFPITSDVVLKRRGTHKDISYEIVNHSRSRYAGYGADMVPSPGTWCYYVLVSEHMMPPESFASFWLEPSRIDVRSSGIPDPRYEYCSAAFAEADWHGGVTYYEKFGGIDQAPRFVKIGCDFAHYWDEGREYTYEQIEAEAKHTIDLLANMFPFYRRCHYSGRWQPESEMVEINGRLWSKEGIESDRKYRAERATA